MTERKTIIFTNSDTYDPTKIEIVNNQAKLKIGGGTSNLNYTDDMTSSSDKTFDTSKVEIISSNAQLKLIDKVIDFNQPFDSDIGFTYDNTKAEFTGGLVRQKDQRPSNSTIGVTFTSSQNANWGNGTLTGTLLGNSVISGGKLDCTVSGNNGCWWNDTGNNGIAQTGTIRFKYTPDFSGAATVLNNLVALGQTSGTPYNRIVLMHRVGGTLRFYLDAFNGTSVHSNIILATWLPTAGQEYEFEFNIDCTQGHYRLFIDGVKVGEILTGICTHNASTGRKIVLGNDESFTYTQTGKFDNFELFSTVQHTSNYTPGYSIPETIYASNNVTLPEMEDTNPGTIQLFNAFTTTETGTPRYTLQIGRSGNYLYWNGSAWVTSNNTYAQANTAAVFNTNAPSLPVSGEIYGQFKMLFDDSNTISSVSDLNANMTIQEYSTSNPSVLYNTNIITVSLPFTMLYSSFIETSIKNGSDEIKYLLSYDNGLTWYYYNSGWVESNSSYTQSTTASIINSNISTFPVSSGTLLVKFFLHSNDGSTTPKLDKLVVNYIQNGYSINNPTIITNQAYPIKTLDGFFETATKPSTTELKYIFVDGTQNKYFNGNDWVNSDGTYTQSNTATEIDGNRINASFINNVKVKVFLHSNDGLETPIL